MRLCLILQFVCVEGRVRVAKLGVWALGGLLVKECDLVFGVSSATIFHGERFHSDVLACIIHVQSFRFCLTNN